MADVFRTMIVRGDDVSLARLVADMFAGRPQQMWLVGLSKTGNPPATHYISTGIVPERYQTIAPFQVWQQEFDGWTMFESYSGDPQTVYEATVASSLGCTINEIQIFFANSDITEQEPFVALDRLGLKIIQEDRNVPANY